MTAVPPEAVQAAAEALAGDHGCAAAAHERTARAALEAALPLIAAAERERAVRLAAIYLGPRVLRKYAASLEPEDEQVSHIEATGQIGAGKKITDRAGRVWEYRTYNSPSGPAFWLTPPEEFWPLGTANYTVHFDGVMGVSQGDSP